MFTPDGEIRGIAQQEFTQFYPQPGWVEHDPREIWSSQAAVMVQALSDAQASPRDIAAIGISNQRETTVLWDRHSGEPVHNAIVWQDRRTAPWCSALRDRGLSGMIQTRTGLLPDAYFSASKVAWLLDQDPALRTRSEAGEIAFGTIDTWLLWNLTQGRVHATDVTNASRTMLCGLGTGEWDATLLSEFGIPEAILPEIRPSSAIYGETSHPLLPQGIPIGGVAGDQQAALFGQACFQPGMAKNTYGTGCFLLRHTGNEAPLSRHSLLTTVAAHCGDRLEYAIEGSIFVAGAVVQWLRDGLGLIRTAADIEPLAASVPDSGGICLVPAFAGLGAPHWDPYARGTITGITRGTSAGHFARAALEAIAFQVDDLLRAMEADGASPLSELRVDGGAARNDLLMQIQADLLGVPVVRPSVTETTALGAAYLAGLAVGELRGREEISAQWKLDRRFEPGPGSVRLAGMRETWSRAVERSRRWTV